MISLQFDFASFRSDWANCDRIASYVGSLIARDRLDPLRYGNTVSSALNELLELTYHSGLAEGVFVCEAARGLEADRLSVVFPAPESSRESIMSASRAEDHGLSNAIYLASLAEPGRPSVSEILLGLRVNFDARIDAVAHAGNRVSIMADIRVQDLLN